jgi:hypothetical protein
MVSSCRSQFRLRGEVLWRTDGNWRNSWRYQSLWSKWHIKPKRGCYKPQSSVFIFKYTLVRSTQWHIKSKRVLQTFRHLRKAMLVFKWRVLLVVFDPTILAPEGQFLHLPSSNPRGGSPKEPRRVHGSHRPTTMISMLKVGQDRKGWARKQSAKVLLSMKFFFACTIANDHFASSMRFSASASSTSNFYKNSISHQRHISRFEIKCQQIHTLLLYFVLTVCFASIRRRVARTDLVVFRWRKKDHLETLKSALLLPTKSSLWSSSTLLVIH